MGRCHASATAAEDHTQRDPARAGRRRRNTAVGIEVAGLVNAMRSVLLLACLGIAATSLMAGAGDVDRIQGVVTELHPQGFVLATEGRTVVVDMSALGGITAAVETGESIAAIGTMESGSRTLHAIRLEASPHTDTSGTR